MAVLTVLQSWGMLACLGIFASGLAYLLATLTGVWVVAPPKNEGDTQ